MSQTPATTSTFPTVQPSTAAPDGAAVTTRIPAGHRDAFGPQVAVLTAPGPDNSSLCLLHGIFPSGAVVPVHSHADRETFYVVSGELEAWDGRTWRALRAGDVFDVPGHQRHAWRNRSGGDATALIATTSCMGRFFREILREPAAAHPGPPTLEELAYLGEVAARYGYVNGGPEENAAAGLG